MAPSLRFPLGLMVAAAALLPARAQNPARGSALISLESWKSELPFSFRYGGRDSSRFLSGWQRTEATAPGPGRHDYIFIDPATGLKVTAEVRTFTDFDAIEWVLKFANEGPGDTPIIEQIEPLHWTVAPPGACTLHYARGSNAQVSDFEPRTETFGSRGTFAIGSSNGRSSDTNSLPFFNLQMGNQGVIGAIGWTGNWSTRFNYGPSTLTIAAGMPKTHFLLHPGETVRTPRILLLNWQGGDWPASQNVWRRLVLAHYSPLEPDGRAVAVPYCLGAWGTERIEAKLALVRSLREKQVPFDVYWIDAGWYGDEAPKTGAGPDMDSPWFRFRGSWTPNAVDYPHGFRPLGDALKEAGYGFLLWFEPETADPGTALRAEHPDWFLQVPHPVNPGTAMLNLGNPEARRGITAIVSDLITAAGLTWYRQDFNIPADAYWARADAPDRVGLTEINYITGLYQFWDDLRAGHPGLQIDNCSSGGRRLDLETMSRSVSLWRTDYECNFFDPVGGQLETQGLAPWVPLNAGNYGGVAPGTPNEGASLVYAMRSNYSAGLVLNPGDRGAEGALSLDLMKTVGEEFHDLQPCFTGDFYALQAYTPALDSWAVWQFDRPDLQTGAVILFRRQNSTRAALKPGLQAIDPRADYEVEIRAGFGKNPPRLMSGRDLAQLEIAIPERPGSVLVLYRRR